jgi:hypothetical protein
VQDKTKSVVLIGCNNGWKLTVGEQENFSGNDENVLYPDYDSIT